MKLNASPVSEHKIDDLCFYLKRDDLLHPTFSGNKARKFASLLAQSHGDITTVISYGSAQANSLYSLAALAQLKGWRLEFYVDRIPVWLVENPRGNYAAAMSLGADVIDLSKLEGRGDLHPAQYIDAVRQPGPDALIIPEGGRFDFAEEGVKGLAQEIIEWKNSLSLKELNVALPSGTGTTSLYLHKHFADEGVNVLTCACVGGEAYLRQQWRGLAPEMKSFPKILPHRKHHFGKLYREDYLIWQKLKEQTGVEFELLYDPLMWPSLLEQASLRQTPLMYIHQGGLLGNETMLPRYERKFGV
ncbi:1-aminocyclopropane-1-carboxylate deaminase [Veronia nyctiphanis]|uniref:1-aminocyclopropane-1-carboxylate deaminase n=1 Tax=Veronia nyctiphanis TaxID=1278244 RepID=A0A4Q0YSZ8_9GAMM|nr:1-aminocyclopropane-1-carboxylate deaminase/D-cysteine desulfhydrase [Veronia nyctiphanis]RXJ73264.1 1-aminocyclopropane-1-carboxylate deaminase [Veronia nyctiphanis]